MIAEPTWEGLHPRRPSDAGGSHSTFSRALPGRSLISKKATFMSTVWVSSLGTQKETLFALGAGTGRRQHAEIYGGWKEVKDD